MSNYKDLSLIHYKPDAILSLSASGLKKVLIDNGYSIVFSNEGVKILETSSNILTEQIDLFTILSSNILINSPSYNLYKRKIEKNLHNISKYNEPKRLEKEKNLLITNENTLNTIICNKGILLCIKKNTQLLNLINSKYKLFK